MIFRKQNFYKIWIFETIDKTVVSSDLSTFESIPHV